MIDFYNAFISYKHGPRDNKVAAHVQSQLEHFHIPGKIRKKTGKTRIQRIFRDKDELPITSNLTETIENALQKSEFLIVICSPHTKESIWVRREIEFFLKTHDRDHILAVLSEGEPQDALPQELLEEEVTITQPNGATYTYTREKEPLCCDYRGSFRKADNEELPRLAAALIGCSYDELMNRRRAYQMRRITVLGLVLTSLALGFMGYMTYSRNKLQKSYNETLRSQSIYLANESEKLLSQQQRIEAIQLALAALPSDEKDRPVTSEAIHALTEATLAYKPLFGTNIYAVWNYRAPARISTMAAPSDHTSLAAMDQTKTLTVWDTETHEVLMTKSFGKETIGALTYVGDKLLITTNSQYALFDVFKGKQVWAKKSDGSNLLLTDPLIAEEGESFYLVTSSREILHIRTKDGQTLDSHKLPEKIEEHRREDFDFFSLSPDEKKIAFAVNSWFSTDLDGSSGNSLLVVLDLTDDSIIYTPVPRPTIHKIAWTADDKVVAYAEEKNSDSYLTNPGVTNIESKNDLVFCFDLTSKKELWSDDFTYFNERVKSGFLNLPSIEAVACFCGNILKIYDIKTGEVLHSYDFCTSIVDISDIDGDGSPLAITSNGCIGSVLTLNGKDAVSLMDEFPDEIFLAMVGGGVYLVPEYSSQILYYGVQVSDEEWTEIDEDIKLASVKENYILDKDYLVLSSFSDKTPYITAYDAVGKELLWQISLDKEISLQNHLLGIYEDELFAITKKIGESAKLIRIDMEDGTITKEEEISDTSIGVDRIGSLTDHYLVYYSHDKKGQGDYMCFVDLESGDEDKFVIPFDGFFTKELAPRYFPNADAIYYSDTKNGDYIVSVGQRKTYEVKLPKDWSGTFVVECDSKGGNWIIADATRVLVVGSSGHIEQEIGVSGLYPLGASFYSEKKTDDQILVVYNDGTLLRYDAESGEFISKTTVDTIANVEFAAKLYVTGDKKLLMIDTGPLTDIVDTESWLEIGSVRNSLGYHEATDVFFAYSNTKFDDYRVGYFRHYTLSDLIDKAHRILGNNQITDELKSQYGIE